ncbi:hypothetical protein GWI33_004307 [Rhynchophorus ferrugineus]|uniref:Uncharacterized protein n=1 Tax=Rhynchophorus ferrugineus TaxID=354439 RepID=A0A834IN90_RHYFE|nr:hypothetical protein GWI33_004307 [Rhynchophorus ferrugineus]
MRRSSVARLQSQTSEPVIVVEDQENEDDTQKSSSQHSSEDESPSMNPYLLSPFGRDVRKHSLPTPQCSGITASQIRRLSDRGESGPGPRQAEFLATLCQAPQVSPGGRRHSVVTISKVPTTLFGRNRRESVAAFPSGGFPSRVLPNRRESIACPPSTDTRGSVHNLQLDIMDDIVQSRKVRMKVWNTSSEKLCEVQPLDEPSGSVQRYTNAGRRYSDFVGTSLPPIISSSKRRASELPPIPTTSKIKPGIVCTNTDLVSILSSLSTSATEIDQWEKEVPNPQPKTARTQTNDDPQPASKSRSNSFDMSVLKETLTQSTSQDQTKQLPCLSNWFSKRHQPKAAAAEPAVKKPSFLENISKKIIEKEPGKVMWDERSGSLVDAQALGSAIEVFLRQSTPDFPSAKDVLSPGKTAKLTERVFGAANKMKASWFSKGDEEHADTCDTSLCSTLKDLFS